MTKKVQSNTVNFDKNKYNVQGFVSINQFYDVGYHN